MNKKLTSNLIDYLSKDLLKNGYCIFDIENQAKANLHMEAWEKVFEEVGYDKEWGFFVPC